MLALQYPLTQPLNTPSSGSSKDYWKVWEGEGWGSQSCTRGAGSPVAIHNRHPHVKGFPYFALKQQHTGKCLLLWKCYQGPNQKETAASPLDGTALPLDTNTTSRFQKPLPVGTCSQVQLCWAWPRQRQLSYQYQTETGQSGSVGWINTQQSF